MVVKVINAEFGEYIFIRKLYTKELNFLYFMAVCKRKTEL